MSRVRELSWPLALIAGLLLLGCETNRQRAPETGAGGLIFVRETDQDFARLQLLRINVDSKALTKLHDGVASSLPTIANESSMAVFAMYAESGGPALNIVDFAAGTHREFTGGFGPASGLHGFVAYCAEDGREVRSGSMTEPSQWKVLVRYAQSRGCPQLSWSGHDRLALADRPPDQPSGGPELLVFEPSLAMTNIPLPAGNGGVGEISWSFDDSLLAVELGGRILLLDRAANTTSWIQGIRPRFSPVSGSIAVINDATASLRILTNEGSEIASLPLGSTDVSYAWSPDGSTLAIATLLEIVIWNPKTGRVDSLYKAIGDERISVDALYWSPAS